MDKKIDEKIDEKIDKEIDVLIYRFGIYRGMDG
jgi:hypothetical protein